MALTTPPGVRQPPVYQTGKPPAYSAARSIFRGPKGKPRKDTQAVLKNVKRTII